MADEITSTPESVLVIMAHPDDLEFMVGGSIARWAKQGSRVRLLLVTRGEGGNQNHPDWDAARVARERHQEQAAAAAMLGLEAVDYLDEPDGETVPTLVLRRRLVEEIRAARPAVVVLPDPTRYYHGRHINHPDHRAVGEAALAAVFPLAGNPMYGPTLGAPHKIREAWITLATEPNCWVDISPFMDAKLDAIRCHTSQVEHMTALPDMVRSWNEHAEADGSVTYREWFRRVVY